MGTNLNDYATGKSKNMTVKMYEPRKGETLTIDKIGETGYKDDRGNPKLCIHWVEDRPPMVLNKTSIKWLIGQFGPAEKDYAGRKVIVWHDPTVEMNGKLVGGLKLALPKGAKPVEPQVEGPDDEIPF
jgi:hypothetical protein